MTIRTLDEIRQERPPLEVEALAFLCACDLSEVRFGEAGRG